ncbi:Ctr copper transporter [Ascodesmis nigricans]|uniref:Copper transport protein n=1 Tax=Ascodesmis nigricans TaxID=341454 RepID=A0A4S2MYV9_9PEZI|nr:Ctr copper transporter [Ascodesmis nigricans]
MDHPHHHHEADETASSAMMPPSGGHRCQMSMLFTWNTQDLCLVFRWWHVSGPISLVLSLLVVVALGMGYEYVREITRRYEARVDAANAQNIGGELPDNESSSLLTGRAVKNSQRKGQTGKALLYAIQVFYSFFIMLLFMTYNGWVMIAVAVGAFFGYILWGGSNATKSVACH